MTRSEILGVAIILGVISVAAYFNLQNSVLLARDVQRKNDLKHIAAALTDYTNRAGGYPKSSQEGKIVNCGEGLSLPCRWGLDPLTASDSAVMERLPNDPSWQEGVSYLYRSNTRDYQLYAGLEDKEDDEYSGKIAEKGFACGTKVCNFGLSSSKLPLTENIE